MSSTSAPVACVDEDPDSSGPRTAVPAAAHAPLVRVRLDAEQSRDDECRWRAAEARLKELVSHSFVRRAVGLPDVHWKADMELPSSVAVDCGDHLVPNVTSVAMNDCMSLVVTDWRSEHISRDFLAGKYRLTSELLDAIEHGGRLPTSDVGPRELARLVPKLLLRRPGFRAEFGLNFGGNHFLEVQSVSDLVDPAIARQWNLAPGQVTLMTHLGPGPFTGNLLHLYSSRTKVRAARRAAYLAIKLPLHVLGRHQSSLAERYRAYFKTTKFSGFALDSEIGQDLDRVIRLGCNFGYAYQVGCYKAVLDALVETARAFNLPDPHARMLWSVSHNHIFRERVGQTDAFIGRHNSVRAYAGRPALLSGTYSVDSCLGIGLTGGEKFLRSYDHGAGALLAGASRSQALPEIGGTSASFKFRRGQPQGLQQVAERALRSRHLVEQVMAALHQKQIIRPVCYLRPLGTMRN
ncbi:MAG: RtcB family protein [Planctomycetia bacterium]|nr:RtcB family protein [Planctomycetia bacterium]